MVRKVLMVDSIKALGSWFWDKAVRRLVSRFKMRGRLKWDAGGFGGGDG